MEFWKISLTLALSLLKVTNVTGANYRPAFTSTFTVIQVNEDEPVGFEVAQLKAIDLEGDQITFSLDDIGKEILNVGASNGNLTLKVKLDREARSSYQFKAYLEDNYGGGGESRRTSKVLYLQVRDANDNKPFFVGLPYVAEVYENETAGYLVLRVSATDADLGNNGAVSYNFSDNHHINKFSIDNVTGEIRLTGKLDYKITQQYHIVVEAKDGGVPQLISQTSVIINVMYVGENPFLLSPCVKKIEENKNKSSVAPEVMSVSTITDAKMSLDLKWKQELADFYSKEYQELRLLLKKLITECYGKSNYLLIDVLINSFIKGSVIARFQLVFAEKTNDTLLPLKNYLQNHNNTLGHIKVDALEEVGRLSPHHNCTKFCNKTVVIEQKETGGTSDSEAIKCTDKSAGVIAALASLVALLIVVVICLLIYIWWKIFKKNKIASPGMTASDF